MCSGARGWAWDSWSRRPLSIATTIELRRGGEAALPHALAAVCIGVSVVLWTTVLAIDFLISFSYTVSPRRPNAA
jgi:hypothetical protein